MNPDKVNREARDDEIEFTRIPIAGEDSEDYDVDYDTEEEEDEVTDEETTTLPIVFPIQWSTPPPNLPLNESFIDLNAYIADEIAFRVGPRKDGIIEEIRFSPASLTPNSFQSLTDSSECNPYMQNMQSFTKYEHQRKLTKSERNQKREYQQWRERLEEAPTTTREPKRKHSRLTRPSLTVHGTPDNEPPKRPKRFPVPDYSHRDSTYKQPPLVERLLVSQLFSEAYDPETGLKRHENHETRTENDFDFSEEGFVDELFMLGGKEMVRDYKQRKVTDDKDEDSDSSVNSVKLYEKAFASFRPEFGESNAEAAERHRLIKERVVALKYARKQQKVNETTPRLTTRFQDKRLDQHPPT